MSMLSKYNPLEASPQALMDRCKAGERDACATLTSGKMGFMLHGNRQMIEQVSRGQSIKMEDGGFMEPTMDAPQEEDFMPLLDVLGEEAFSVIENLMQEYPEVVLLAEMATKTSDGYVEGEGGPKDDMVPARLSDGEYVFSAEAVDVIGVENLEVLHEQAKAKASAE